MTNEEQKKELEWLTVRADSGILDDNGTEEIAKFLANPSSIAADNTAEFKKLANIVCDYTIKQSTKAYLNIHESVEFVKYVAALHDLTSKNETQYLSDNAKTNWEQNKKQLLQISLLLIEGMLGKYTEKSAQEKTNQRTTSKSFLQLVKNFLSPAKTSPSPMLALQPVADTQEKLINIQKKLTAALQQISPSVPTTETPTKVVETIGAIAIQPAATTQEKPQPAAPDATQPIPAEAAPKPTTKTFLQRLTDIFSPLYTWVSSLIKSKADKSATVTDTQKAPQPAAQTPALPHSNTAEIERAIPSANEPTKPIQTTTKARPVDVARDTKKIAKDAHREITYYLLSIATEKSRGKSVEPIDIGPIVKNLLDKQVIDDPFSSLSKNPYAKIIIRDQTTGKIYNIEGGSAHWMKCEEITKENHPPELQKLKSSTFPKETGILQEHHVKIGDNTSVTSKETPVTTPG